MKEAQEEMPMTQPNRPDELSLHAWLDGELDPEAAAEVARWLADHPQEAARVAALQAQRAELQSLNAQVLHEPVPLHLQQAVRRPHLQWRMPHSLAAGLMLAVGLGSGYGLSEWRHGGVPVPSPARQAVASASTLPGFVRDAAAAHVVYVPEKRHPVEVDAAQQAHLVQWLSKRLDRPLKAPALQAQGFQLMGGRLLPGPSGQARAQFMYEDAQGKRLTLYVSALTTAVNGAPRAPAAFQWSAQGSTQGFYWIEGEQGYAVSAELPRAQLQSLAEAIHAQLE